MNVNELGPVGGVEVNVFEISKELSRRDNDVDLVFLRDGIFASEYRTFCRSMHQVPSFSFSSRRALRDLRGMAPAAFAALRIRPDVVFVNHFEEIVYGTLTSRPSLAPLVCHLQWMSVSHHRPARLMSKAVRKFVAVSRFISDRWVEAGVDPRRIEVVPNGVDLRSYPPGGTEELLSARRELGLPTDAFVALYYGRIDKEKGVEVLLDAWSRMSLDPRRARLLIVGSPVLESAQYLDQLKARAPAGCEWRPMARDVVTPLHAADVVVLPSVVDDPAPRVVLETLATGRPIVASRTGGIPEVLEGPLSRLLFAPGDDEGLAGRLVSVMDWRTGQPGLGAACTARIAEHFSFDVMVDGIENVLNEVVEKR